MVESHTAAARREQPAAEISHHAQRMDLATSSLRLVHSHSSYDSEMLAGAAMLLEAMQVDADARECA